MSDRDDGKGTRVYVGGLTEGIKKEDLENEFEKFGKLNSVWVAFNPPGFAFIEFTSHGDAETACDNLNGSDFLGSKLRVEIARGTGRRGGFRGGRGGPPRRGPPSNGGKPSAGAGGFRSYSGGSSGGERSNGFRGSPRGAGRPPMGSRGGRFDEYPREERYGSREYSRNGSDGFRRGARESFSRGRGSSGGAAGAGGGRHRFDSNSRFRSRSPVGAPRR